MPLDWPKFDEVLLFDYTDKLVIHIMWQKSGLACANVNCSHDCSLTEITTIMPDFAGVEVIFFGKSPSYDPTGYQMVSLISAVRSPIITYKRLS